MPSVTVLDSGALYSPAVGLVYVFNLIVGTGALTMPKAFQEAGWLLSIILLIFLGFMSYLTSTFVLESMASANALLRWKRLQRMKKGGALSEELIIRDLEALAGETSPLLTSLNASTNGNNSTGMEKKPIGYYDITERTEMGEMVTLFFNRIGKNMFYICITVYLYGDLAIYSAAVPKSIRDVACTYADGNKTSMELSDDDICWPSLLITRRDAYRVFVAAFALALGPFVFFNVQKTKYLQLLTTILRWLAFAIMIILCLLYFSSGHHNGHPPMARISGVPNLFGVCVYSFMCHHSLPSLLTPIRSKQHLVPLLLLDYVLILILYLFLSLSAIFTFASVEDLYTLNFEPSYGREDGVTNFLPIQYFLTLFPVFTLSTNFPIIAITLRNNLYTLLIGEESRLLSSTSSIISSPTIARLIIPLLALLPPIAVALGTSDLEFLVGITGSYAGTTIQYLFPAFLVLYSRKDMSLTLGSLPRNPHASPFSHRYWVYVVLLWSLTCIAFVTVNHITSGA